LSCGVTNAKDPCSAGGAAFFWAENGPWAGGRFRRHGQGDRAVRSRTRRFVARSRICLANTGDAFPGATGPGRPSAPMIMQDEKLGTWSCATQKCAVRHVHVSHRLHRAFAGVTSRARCGSRPWITHATVSWITCSALFRTGRGRWAGSTEHCSVELQGRRQNCPAISIITRIRASKLRDQDQLFRGHFSASGNWRRMPAGPRPRCVRGRAWRFLPRPISSGWECWTVTPDSSLRPRPPMRRWSGTAAV